MTPIMSGKVMVTGASGFVGGYVVRELTDRGYEPVCLVRSPDRLARRLGGPIPSQLTTVVGDLFDEDALHTAAHGCRAAIHLVGMVEEQPKRGRTFERIHVEGTRNVLAACGAAGVQRYAHMSALGSRPHAASRYHRTKWQAEELVRQAPLAWTIFRPSVIHGPEGEFMRMMKFFCTSRLRQPVMPYFGRGASRLQPVSVLDIAACFVRCLSLPETMGQTY